MTSSFISELSLIYFQNGFIIIGMTKSYERVDEDFGVERFCVSVILY